MGNGPNGVAVNPAGNRVYVTNRFDGTVSVIDPVINKAVTAVTVGEGPSGVAVDPAGSRIYVANTGDDTVSVLNAKTHKITATVPVGNGPKAFGQFIGKPSSRPTKTRPSS